jgi:hypothetical protein
MDSRRSFLQVAAAAVASLGGVSRLFGTDTPPPVGTRSTRPKPAERSAPAVPRPVITPDVKNLPFTLDNGTKAFQLVAEPVKRKIAPWKTIDCWCSMDRRERRRWRSRSSPVRGYRAVWIRLPQLYSVVCVGGRRWNRVQLHGRYARSLTNDQRRGANTAKNCLLARHYPRQKDRLRVQHRKWDYSGIRYRRRRFAFLVRICRCHNAGQSPGYGHHPGWYVFECVDHHWKHRSVSH